MVKFSKVLLIIFSLSVLLSATGCAPKTIGNIGENEMKAYEYQFFLKNAKQQIENGQGIANNPDYISQLWENQESVAYLREVAMENLKVHRIMLEEAKKNEFKLSKEDEKKIKDSIEEEIKANGGEKKFLVELEKELEGITIKDYRQLKYDVNYSTKYMIDFMENIEVSDNEIKDYYEENKDSLDYTTVRHILVSTKNDSGAKLSDDKIEEAKEKADEILEKVKSGEDMIKLVEEYSEDPGKAQNQGEYDVKKGVGYAAEFESWALSAKVGDVGIVETELGYHVMKCEKKSSLDDIEFKENVKFYIQDLKMQEEIEKLSEKSEYRIVQDTDTINSLRIPGLDM